MLVYLPCVNVRVVTYFSGRQTHHLAVLPNVEWQTKASVLINDLFACRQHFVGKHSDVLWIVERFIL